MTMNLDDVNVGGQLKVGSGVVPAVGEGDKRVNGSVYAEGPVQIGDQGAFGSNTATLMVGRTTNSCLLYTSPSPRDISGSRMPSSA